ncbi:MAG: anti-sigma regulatory factor [Candidatus Velthaea sp.]
MHLRAMRNSVADAQPQRLEIVSDADVVRVRQAVRTLALQAALSIVDQTKMVTAASELARNTLIHGGGGAALLELVRDRDRDRDRERVGVRATFSDEGPGIADLEVALAGGVSSAGGMGLGLSGSKRLVDVFDLETNPGGTRVTITKWKR